MFLQAGKFMPGMEKLAGELFFPTNQQLFLTTEGSKNSWFQEKKSSPASFSMPGINFSAYRIHFLCCWPYEFGPLDSNFARFCFILPLQISLISWPIGRPPAERRGVQGGAPPAKAKRLLLRYCKKRLPRMTANWGFLEVPWGLTGDILGNT